MIVLQPPLALASEPSSLNDFQSHSRYMTASSLLFPFQEFDTRIQFNFYFLLVILFMSNCMRKVITSAFSHYIILVILRLLF